MSLWEHMFRSRRTMGRNHTNSFSSSRMAGCLIVHSSTAIGAVRLEAIAIAKAAPMVDACLSDMLHSFVLVSPASLEGWAKRAQRN